VECLHCSRLPGPGLEHANPQVARCSRPFQRPDNRRTRRGQLSRGHLRIWTAPTNPVPVSSANMHGTGTTQPAAIAVLAKRQVSFPSVARSNIMGPCSCSRFTNHHACEASQLHRIASQIAGINVSQRPQIYSAAAGCGRALHAACARR
jgi:hypothetical protein